MSLVLGDCGSKTSSGLKNAVKRKTPDSETSSRLKNPVKRKTPDSVLINKEKDAVFRKSPDSDLTEEEMDSLMRNPRPAILTKKQLAALAAARKKKMDKKSKEIRDQAEYRHKCMREDPDYFANLTGVDAAIWKMTLHEKEIEEELRAEEEEELRAEKEEERRLQKLLTQK